MPARKRSRSPTKKKSKSKRRSRSRSPSPRRVMKLLSALRRTKSKKHEKTKAHAYKLFGKKMKSEAKSASSAAAMRRRMADPAEKAKILARLAKGRAKRKANLARRK